MANQGSKKNLFWLWFFILVIAFTLILSIPWGFSYIVIAFTLFLIMVFFIRLFA